ncbi:MAG: MBL fold metallo-hydrolase [Dehalococcoidales bacterium]|nr:MBL fold metallo-hydrolase [Dehalococcoidales bacterium]
MAEGKGSLNTKPFSNLYRVEKERLNGTSTELTTIRFIYKANMFIFSYPKEGKIKYTFIDTGHSIYREQIVPILLAHDIDPTQIERIIITHCHPDHCGSADLLALKSNAKILAHPRFRDFVEKEVEAPTYRWPLGYPPPQLKECDIEYLAEANPPRQITLGGVSFPFLGEPVEIGEGGKLLFLASPECKPTHSPDQMIVYYSPSGYITTEAGRPADSRPTDDLLISGDLWLMVGPPRSAGYHLRNWLLRMKSVLLGKGRRPVHREQDSMVKEALKRGFDLIRVKPGHGEEFLGTRIVRLGVLSDSDILLELGLPITENRAILKSKELAGKIEAIKEQAYNRFASELPVWQEMGYSQSEIIKLLVRIYKEQSGGDRFASRDRKQRRERLKATLSRLKDDETKPEELRRLAGLALDEIRKVR